MKFSFVVVVFCLFVVVFVLVGCFFFPGNNGFPFSNVSRSGY